MTLDVKFLKRFEKVFLTTKKIFMRKKIWKRKKYFCKIFFSLPNKFSAMCAVRTNIFIFLARTAPATPHQQWFASANLENRVPRFLCRDAIFRCGVPWCPSIFRDFIEIATNFGFFRKMAFWRKTGKSPTPPWRLVIGRRGRILAERSLKQFPARQKNKRQWCRTNM